MRLPFFTLIMRNWTVLILNCSVRVKPFRHVLRLSYLTESFEAKKKDHCCHGRIWLKYSLGISSKLSPNGLRLSNTPRNLLVVVACMTHVNARQLTVTLPTHRVPKTATYALFILSQGGYITTLLINECVTRPLYSIQRRLMADRNMYVVGHD